MSADHCNMTVGLAALLLLCLAILVLGTGIAPQAESQAIQRSFRDQTGTTEPNLSAAKDGPIVITRGGIYRGKWQSMDVGTPAVTIRTAEPVVIEHAELSGRFHLIMTDCQHANITVHNSIGRGLNPNITGRCPGRFLDAEYFDNVVIEYNELVGTSGIYLLNYRGDFTAAETVRIIGNKVRNIDGRKSDGKGGFLDFNERVRRSDGSLESGFRIVQFLQLDKVRNVPGMEIAWNEVINEPRISRVEDNINIFLSSGTAASPLLIHDNYIQGAYTIKPWQGNSRDQTWDYDWGYSGGGLLLGDGPARTRDEAAAFVRAESNQVVSTTNYGIAIAAGHDIEFSHNRIISHGSLPDGKAIKAQNVGAYIWDSYHNSRSGTFFNNRGHANLIGWVRDGRRNDWWVPDASSWTKNVHWPGDLTLAAEAAEFLRWQKKLADARVSVGPSRGR